MNRRQTPVDDDSFRGGAEGEAYRAEVPADVDRIPGILEEIMRRGVRAGFPSDRLRLNLRVGVCEALSNAIRHGEGEGPGSVRVEATFSAATIEVRIADTGAGFVPEDVPDPTLPENLSRPGGRGVFLIQTLMDLVEYNEVGNALRMVLHARPEDEGEPEPAVAEPLALPAVAREFLQAYADAHRAGLRVLRKDGAGGAAEVVYQRGWEDAEGPAKRGHHVLRDGALLDVAMKGEGASDARAAFAAAAAARLLGFEHEARSTATELAERYEEINLLYTISEILASVLSLDDATQRILAQVADVLGARRATLWTPEASGEALRLRAYVGAAPARERIPRGDADSVTARVFRSGEPVNLERGVEFKRAAPRVLDGPREALLAVPVSYTPPDGETRRVGAITLVGHTGSERFTAGDARMLAAIASQVGAALEAQRLVQQSLQRERLARDMELAHHLQAKLLPDIGDFADFGEVAARNAPAGDVGGDLYQLIRLPDGRMGVMIGDVSSHGVGAALIMALTMSALAIHARESASPGEVLMRVYDTLRDELESTEMFLTLFYGVIHPGEGLVYANAGHPHAFRIGSGGPPVRLPATQPPLGMARVSASEMSSPWSPGDTLCLFTDGLSDAYPARGAASGEDALMARIGGLIGGPLETVVAAVIGDTDGGLGGPPVDDRTILLVRP